MLNELRWLDYDTVYIISHPTFFNFLTLTFDQTIVWIFFAAFGLLL